MTNTSKTGPSLIALSIWLNRYAVACAMVAVVVIMRLPSSALAESVARLSLDDAATLGTTIQTDASVKTEGRASVRITTLHPTTICLGQILGLDVEKATLIYTAKVKSALDGVAYLEMWAHVGGGRYFSRGMNDPIEGRTDWKSIQTLFRFQEGQRPDKVVLNIVINGTGTVWVDDLTLAKTLLN
jgi:hypothetical protein